MKKLLAWFSRVFLTEFQPNESLDRLCTRFAENVTIVHSHQDRKDKTAKDFVAEMNAKSIVDEIRKVHGDELKKYLQPHNTMFRKRLKQSQNDAEKKLFWGRLITLENI